MIDTTLVIRKINLISQDLNELLSISRKSVGEYLASPVDEVLAERYLERAIGRNFLPPGLAHQIAACAGLRNRIVHEYDEIDPRKLYEGLQAAVRDIPQYLAHIHQYLQRPPTD